MEISISLGSPGTDAEVFLTRFIDPTAYEEGRMLPADVKISASIEDFWSHRSVKLALDTNVRESSGFLGSFVWYNLELSMDWTKSSTGYFPIQKYGFKSTPTKPKIGFRVHAYSGDRLLTASDYTCKICERTLSSVGQLSNHMSVSHSDAWVMKRHLINPEKSSLTNNYKFDHFFVFERAQPAVEMMDLTSVTPPENVSPARETQQDNIAASVVIDELYDQPPDLRAQNQTLPRNQNGTFASAQKETSPRTPEQPSPKVRKETSPRLQREMSPDTAPEQELSLELELRGSRKTAEITGATSQKTTQTSQLSSPNTPREKRSPRGAKKQKRKVVVPRTQGQLYRNLGKHPIQEGDLVSDSDEEPDSTWFRPKRIHYTERSSLSQKDKKLAHMWNDYCQEHIGPGVITKASHPKWLQRFMRAQKWELAFGGLLDHFTKFLDDLCDVHELDPQLKAYWQRISAKDLPPSDSDRNGWIAWVDHKNSHEKMGEREYWKLRVMIDKHFPEDKAFQEEEHESGSPYNTRRNRDSNGSTTAKVQTSSKLYKKTSKRKEQERVEDNSGQTTASGSSACLCGEIALGDYQIQVCKNMVSFNAFSIIMYYADRDLRSANNQTTT